VLLELLRTGLLLCDFADEVLLRTLLVEADFYMLSTVLKEALLPIEDGLYTARAQQDSGHHPWLLFVECTLQQSRGHPCQVLMTGVLCRRHHATTSSHHATMQGWWMTCCCCASPPPFGAAPA
jgi:hypothetical protein